MNMLCDEIRKRLRLTPGRGAGERERTAELALNGAQRAQDVVRVAARARRAAALRAARAHRRRHITTAFYTTVTDVLTYNKLTSCLGPRYFTWIILLRSQNVFKQYKKHLICYVIIKLALTGKLTKCNLCY